MCVKEDLLSALNQYFYCSSCFSRINIECFNCLAVSAVNVTSLMYGHCSLHHHYERVSYQEKIKNLRERVSAVILVVCSGLQSLCFPNRSCISILCTSYCLFKVMLPSLEKADVKFL